MIPCVPAADRRDERDLVALGKRVFVAAELLVDGGHQVRGLGYERRVTPYHLARQFPERGVLGQVQFDVRGAHLVAVAGEQLYDYPQLEFLSGAAAG